MNHVHIGAGRLGLGYMLWARRPGVRTTLANRIGNPEKLATLKLLQQDHQFFVRSEDGEERVEFDDFLELGSNRAHTEALAAELKSADILTVAVTSKSLDGTAVLVADALAETDRTEPLVVLAFENYRGGTEHFARLVEDFHPGPPADVPALLPCNVVVDRRCTFLGVEDGRVIVRVNRDAESKILVADARAREAVSLLLDVERAKVTMIDDRDRFGFFELQKYLCVNGLDYVAATYARRSKKDIVQEALKDPRNYERAEAAACELAIALSIVAVESGLGAEFPLERNREFANKALERLVSGSPDLTDRVLSDLGAYEFKKLGTKLRGYADRLCNRNRELAGTAQREIARCAEAASDPVFAVDSVESEAQPDADEGSPPAPPDADYTSEFESMVRRELLDLVNTVDLSDYFGKLALRQGLSVQKLFGGDTSPEVLRLAAGEGQYNPRVLPAALADHIELISQVTARTRARLAKMEWVVNEQQHH